MLVIGIFVRRKCIGSDVYHCGVPQTDSLLLRAGGPQDGPICSSRMLTARLCASNSSTFANCITAPLTFFSPSLVRFELVMCFVNEERLTPEYCLA